MVDVLVSELSGLRVEVLLFLGADLGLWGFGTWSYLEALGLGLDRRILVLTMDFGYEFLGGGGGVGDFRFGVWGLGFGVEGLEFRA